MEPRLKNQKGGESGADQRAVPRIDLRRSDGHLCKVKFNDTLVFEGAPYDISLNSIAFQIDEESAARLSQCSKVDFDLEIPEHGTYGFKGSLIVNRRLPNGKSKIVFTLERPLTNQTEKTADSNSFEFVFPPDYSVNASIYKPSFFFERTFIKLKKINGNKLSFSLFDLEALIFEDMRLEIFLFDAALQFEPLKVRVTDTFKEIDFLLVEAEILYFPKEVAKRLSQVLIFDFQYSIDEVRKLHLPVPKISDGLKFRFIRSEVEYQEVLKLRLKAYLAAGKVSESVQTQDMMTALDPISRILVAYHGSKIVASIAIAFPTSNDLILDTERAFKNGYPKKIPPKTESIEISRLCTDPQYRGSDLLLRVFEHTYRTLQCGGRKYIITSTDQKFWPLYRKLGFRKTGMSYSHPNLSGLVHEVIVVPVERAQTARGIGPFSWNYLYRDMNEFLFRRKVFDLTSLQKIKLGLYKLIGRIFKIKTKKTL